MCITVVLSIGLHWVLQEVSSVTFLLSEFCNIISLRHTVKHRLSDLMREDGEEILERKSQ